MKYKYSFCSGLIDVYSKILEPFNISPNCFLNYNSETRSDDFITATLHVPAGTKEKYEATEGWNEFSNIVEMEETPIAEIQMPGYSYNKTQDEKVYNLNGQRVDNAQFTIHN